MPFYTYQATNPNEGCSHCAQPFEVQQSISEPRLATCPHCGNAIRKLIQAPALGRSKSSLDQRAKAAGFHKLKKLGKGEYEKQY